MLEIILLIFGIIILLLGMYDFFFTALSGTGAGSIAKYFSHGTYKALQITQSYFGRRIYSFSGLLVNVIVLAVWLLMVWLGLFLIFSSEPEMVTNNSGRIANFWERLYFTAYTLSTLGIGNFAPTTGLAEILTSCFSFFGFIFFTSSMTYFVSVSSAVVNKRTLTRSIHNLGGPLEIAEKLLNLNPSNSFQQALALQEMIDRHATNHQSYPVIHYYAQPEPDASLNINLVRLDEAVTIILHAENKDELKKELEPLRSSLTNFFHHIEKKISRNFSNTKTAVGFSFEIPYNTRSSDNEKLLQRRKLLLSLLQSEGFDWQTVFQWE